VTKSNVSLKPFWAFFLLTYGITWAFWIPAALLGQDVMRFPTLLLHTLGGFGPSLAGIFMIYRTRNPADRRDFWRRVVDFRQIGIGWLALILVIFPLLALVSIAIARLSGGPPHLYTNLARLTAQPLTILFLLPAGLISGPIPEELGWRGFALDRLQARMSPLSASVVLGLSWSLWHLPLFCVSGTTQAGLGSNTLDFWLFLLNPIALSALFAWVYNQTGGSILSAILMHLGFNVTASLLYPLSPQAWLIHAGLLLISMAFTLKVRKGETVELSHRL
jgi:uncharacterized protein